MDVHPDNKKLEFDNSFKGPVEKRHCTDIMFLILIILSWMAMTGIGFVVCGVVKSPTLAPGNPYRLLNGIDYRGQICGIDGPVKQKSKLVYIPNLLKKTVLGVCVEACPVVSNHNLICTYNISVNSLTPIAAVRNVYNGQCMYQVATVDKYNYCIYSEIYSTAISTANSTTLIPTSLGNVNTNSGSAWYKEFTSDLFTSWPIIMGFGFGVSMVVGFIFLFLLQLPGVLLILTWGVIFGIEGFWVVGGILCFNTSKGWAAHPADPHSNTEIKGLEYVGYGLWGIGFIFALIILVLRKRIRLAISITKQASTAVTSMKLLMIWPVIQSLSVLCFLVPWTIYVLYLASSGKAVVSNYQGFPVKTFVFSDNMRYAGIYLLFCWFWTSQHVIAVGQIVVAMAISHWYFTMDKKQIGSLTVLKSIRITLIYHTGTAAFGSLIIAIIKTIRAIVAYLQNKAQKSKNRVLICLLCVIQCCMWCLEKCMKFLNKNAYIQTAIFGYSFCKAARKAFFLILRNILRVAAVSMVGDFILFLGKILIPIGTTFGAYLVLCYTMSDKLHGLFSPCIFVFILSYFVGLMFVEVFGMGISTILQCFIADEETGGKFMNPDINKAVTDTANANIVNKPARGANVGASRVVPAQEIP